MRFTCKVLSKTESEKGDSLTIGFPDEKGQVITFEGEAEGHLDVLIPGACYTIAFVPFVAQDHADADEIAIDAAPTPETPVPVEHAVVLNVTDAAVCEDAKPADVLVAPATEEEVVETTAPEETVAPPVASFDPPAVVTSTDSTQVPASDTPPTA